MIKSQFLQLFKQSVGNREKTPFRYVFVCINNIIINGVIMYDGKRIILNHNIKQNKYLQMICTLETTHGKKIYVIICIVFNMYRIKHSNNNMSLDANGIK